MSELQPKHQFFLKVDLEFLAGAKVQSYTHHSYHSGEGEEKYKLHIESKAETEGECIENVFAWATSLRDALTQFLDERDQKHLEREDELDRPPPPAPRIDKAPGTA